MSGCFFIIFAKHLQVQSLQDKEEEEQEEEQEEDVPYKHIHTSKCTEALGKQEGRNVVCMFLNSYLLP